jgi:hypothetical protein
VRVGVVGLGCLAGDVEVCGGLAPGEASPSCFASESKLDGAAVVVDAKDETTRALHQPHSDALDEEYDERR